MQCYDKHSVHLCSMQPTSEAAALNGRQPIQSGGSNNAWRLQQSVAAQMAGNQVCSNQAIMQPLMLEAPR